MQLNGTVVFEKNYDEYVKGTRLIVNQGGTRSSKTWSIAQLFLTILVTQNDVVLTICRKTLPALKGTAMKDFFEIMRGAGIYYQKNHNRSDNIYRYKTNEVEFISVDEEQKIRGRKRKYLWMNEANEFSYEDFKQLNMRTTGQIFLDYNPSDEFHWIYDHILTRPDCTLIKSTYKDNPFLEKEIVKEIELLREVDQNYWRIYGLGERGVSEAKVYSHWQYVEDVPQNPDETIYGLDFGFNNQTACVRVDIKDREYTWDEKLYESHLTNSQLIERLKTLAIGNAPLYCDSAEPQRIQELINAGFNAKPSDKDVTKGIDTIKSHKWYITKRSTNILKEVKSYSWKTKDDKILDEPVKQNDHLMDAGRYAQHTHTIIPKPFLG